MENKAHALAAGIFVLAVTALLVALAVWLTRDTGVQHAYELTTRDTVTGLQPQATVRFRGIAVGKVTAIGFDPKVTGNVLVRLAVDDGTPITRSTFATLSYQGVTGLAFVQLDDSGESKELLASSDSDPARIPLRPGLLNKLTDQGAAILAQVEETTKRLNQLLASENQQRITGALDSIGQAAGSVNRLVGTLDATVTQRLDPALAAVPALAADAGKTLRSLQATSDDFGRTARRLNEKDGPIDRLAEGSQALSHAAGSVNLSTLPRVNRVTEDASHAVRQLSRTVNNINDNPQSLIFGNGQVPPGPGEAGFAAPGASP
ncbi:MlaD family protein [Variovorax terrae]|uniref:MlaD family protein n=1 Tax=Variovorax terrae TaxID=2923278 RepID=A0A9X2AP22_9BURK|nr:MlaD family protein [Variovorax terrae]MCJ0765393.1 MlaD family protein [Variovorax terrae]